MFQRTISCPHCGAKTSPQANFCPNCGKRLAGSALTCGVCGTENSGDALFCRKCGQSLERSAAPDVYRHRWARGEQDFAVRVEANDLPGLLKRGIHVEPGTNAMLIYQGANRGLVPPGEYTLDTLGQRLKDWFSGNIPERMTILLVDIVPTDIEFNLGGRFTKDPLPIGMSLRLQAEVTEPGKFLVNVLHGRERFTIEDLRQYLYPEITQVADRWLREHTLQELVENPAQPARLELALEEALRTTFAQTGLRFLHVRTMQLNLEPYDEIKSIVGQTNLLDERLVAEMRQAETDLRAQEQRFRADAEAEAQLTQLRAEFEERKAKAELQAKKRFAELARETDLLTLAEETRKIELYKQMRAAVLSDKMDEVRSTADFESFLNGIDRDKLLREKERADLLKTWKEQADDHDRARAHTIARLDVEQEFELRTLAMRLGGTYDREKLDSEIEIARKRADFQFELQRKTAEEEMNLEQERWRIETDRHKTQAEIARLQRQQELDDDIAAAKAGVELLGMMKQVRRLDEEERLRIQRVHELERARELQKLEIERMEAVERQRQAEHEHDLRRIETLGKLGVEALISLSASEQAHILADLKKTEALRGMSEEQILAAAAKDSPEVARALQEKFRAIAEGKAGAREQEMYERLLTEQKESLRQLQSESERRTRETAEAWDKASARAKETA